MGKYGWVSLIFVALSCGGRSSMDGVATSTAGQSGADADNASAGAQSSGGASVGGTSICPDGPLDPQPTEGAACPSAGMACPPYGALSCPLTAVCSAGLKWQISCSSSMLFGACSCPHPVDDSAPTDRIEPSNCVLDADCGANGHCSPSQSHEWCGVFYACHTPKDQCLNDSDCATGTPCDYDAAAKHWVCGNLCRPIPP